jgi:hypothetical protein
MKLRFYARTGTLVPDPRQRRRTAGEQAMYVGRYFDQPKHAYLTSKEGTEFDDTFLDPGQVATLKRACSRDSALWPADEQTALACGVPFVELEFDATNHLWSAKPAAPTKADTKKIADGGKS